MRTLLCRLLVHVIDDDYGNGLGSFHELQAELFLDGVEG